MWPEAPGSKELSSPTAFVDPESLLLVPSFQARTRLEGRFSVWFCLMPDKLILHRSGIQIVDKWKKRLCKSKCPCNAEARFQEGGVKLISNSFISPSTHPEAVIEDFLFNCAAETQCLACGMFIVDAGYYRGNAELTLASESLCALIPLSFTEAPAVHPSPVI